MAKSFKDDPAKAKVASNVCLYLGVIAMFTWVVPLLGLVLPVIGLIAGRRGWQAANRNRARLGTVLCGISLGMGLLLLYWCAQIPDLEDF